MVDTVVQTSLVSLETDMCASVQWSFTEVPAIQCSASLIRTLAEPNTLVSASFSEGSQQRRVTAIRASGPDEHHRLALLPRTLLPKEMGIPKNLGG